MKTRKEMLDRLKEVFHEEVNTKNSWGKNEIKVVFDTCIIMVLTEVIDEEEKNQTIKSN